MTQIMQRTETSVLQYFSTNNEAHWTHFLEEVQKTRDMTDIYACLCGNKVSQANIEQFSTVH